MALEEIERLRRRLDVLDDEFARLGQTRNPGERALVVKTRVKTTYPTAASAFYWCEIQGVTGDEKEGHPGTLTDLGRFVFALNVGTVVPDEDTAIMIHQAKGRWIFRYDG